MSGSSRPTTGPAGRWVPPLVCGEARQILVTDSEELEATSAIVAGFCGLMGWSLLRLAGLCGDVAAEDGQGFAPTLSTLQAFVYHDGDLSPRERAVLEEALSRHCWVAVARGVVGVVLKGPGRDR